MNRDNTRLVKNIFKGYGNFPNNSNLPLVIFQNPFQDVNISPEYFEKCFSNHDWPAAWRNGLFNFHHYHSTAHEVLGVYSGWIKACFGGPQGQILEARKGDVIIIPAGVAHCNKGQSPDFMAVGAYPVGQTQDMKYGKQEERPEVDHNISMVSRPLADPIFGKEGPLMELWN